MPAREELYEAILGSEQWTAFIGFFPGLPFMFPLDPRETVFVPKYNPTRTWTAEGAVGIGGPCVAIYPVESAGGYQLFGRTLPIYDIRQRNAAFRDNPLLLRPGDRVQFHRVDEEELLQAFADVHADRYRYRTEDSPFDLAPYLEWLPTIAEEAEERRAAPRGGGRRDAGAMRSAEILEGGIQTTVQDYPGRRGMQAQGFFPAGPMDHFALRAANLLVGNPSSSAALEITLGNFRFRLDGEATAGDLRCRDGGDRGRRRRRVVGEPSGLRRCRGRGSGLAPGPGFRCFLAVDGGFDVPLLLGSRATYTMGALGGLDGRALAAGRPAVARRAGRGWSRGSLSLPHGCETGVLPCLGGARDARPTGGPGLPDGERHGGAVRPPVADRPQFQPHGRSPRVLQRSSGRDKAAASRAVTRRTSSTTAIRSARSTSTATCP